MLNFTLGTGKSLSEALIFALTNPQYDDRLLIFHENCKVRIPAGQLLFLFWIQNNFGKCTTCSADVLKKINLHSGPKWNWVKIECSVGYLKTSLNQVIGDLVFWPADTQIYSSTGCKRVSQICDIPRWKNINFIWYT